MAKSPHIKNTWENLERIQDTITHEDSIGVSMNDTWELTLKHQFEFFDENGTPIPSGLAERPKAPTKEKHFSAHPLEAFMYYILAGFYPPPELLIIIQESFSYYIDKGGSVSLEHIFFGREKPGVGNYSAQYKRIQKFTRFSICVSMSKVEAKHTKKTPLSQLKLAEKFVNGEWLFETEKLDLDPESFLRKWRKWKSGTLK